MGTEQYFKDFEVKVKEIYGVAEEAKKIGLDPSSKVEIPLARSMAEKVVGLISSLYPQLMDSGIEKRILELEDMWGKMNVSVAFKIAEEIAKQKYCKFGSLLEAIDAGIRLGFAYITLGVVSSPIEGYTKLALGKTRDGKEYFKAFFSGPIRSAGTTASCVVLMLIDYLREIFGYAKYDPTDEEIKRYYIENYDYHTRITNLQYMPTEDEANFLSKNLPIQIAGDPTEKREVSNQKNLERVETNFLRGGMCLMFSEGLAQKAKKGLRLLKSVKEKGFSSSGWDFLEDYVKLQEQREKGIKKDETPTYIKDLVAGRPIFGHPSRSGGFRFRYGRGRTSGFSATSVHPATMAISDGFLAIGTQLKIEKPTKGTVITTCDQIDGPVVKFFNGNVKKLKTVEEARKAYKDVEEIIYLGDLLFPFSDVVNRNANLIKPGYVEEWWKLQLEEKDLEFSKQIDEFNISFEDAIILSEKYKIPLNPKYIFYWTQITQEEFMSLIRWLKKARVSKKIILPYLKSEQEKFAEGKRALELLGVEHEVTLENVVIGRKNSLALLANLGVDLEVLEKEEDDLQDHIYEERYYLDKTILEIVNMISLYEIKDKAGEFIGSRMGRPEKAKPRKLIGSPNVLFPVGQEGGRLKSVLEAVNKGNVRSSFPIYFCDSCKKDTIYARCEMCNEVTKQMYYCSQCKVKSFKACKEHERVFPFMSQSIDMNHYMDSAKAMIGMKRIEMPAVIKGVKGLSSAGKRTEHLAKGLLRAKYNLQVNKDGTIRFDATELPLIAFKPKEISVSVEKLKEIGYTHDMNGNELENENQILELMPHDVLLPSSPESHDEKADDVFFNLANFIDDLLVNFYKKDSYYNIKKKEDLVGHLGVCMAPHNCAGVICRFIGFSNTLGLLASPYMHAAIRRDCDGDEAAIMLLGDVLLNFSRSFLPSHRGGTQDAPLVLNAKIDAGEVDDQILDFELVDGKYPLELYEKAEKKVHSSEVKTILNVGEVLRQGKNPFEKIGFTHDTSHFSLGVVCSSYKTIPTMQEKVQRQMGLVEKIRAVDTSDTARLIIDRHFIKDMRGNLREFSVQNFRCVGCNEIMRRPPLTGVCPKCKGKIIFTVHEGGVRKYLEAAIELADKYHLSSYLRQHLELTKRYIDSVFGREAEKQVKLEAWF